jgi:hypothetical protein
MKEQGRMLALKMYKYTCSFHQGFGLSKLCLNSTTLTSEVDQRLLQLCSCISTQQIK